MGPQSPWRPRILKKHLRNCCEKRCPLAAQPYWKHATVKLVRFSEKDHLVYRKHLEKITLDSATLADG